MSWIFRRIGLFIIFYFEFVQIILIFYEYFEHASIHGPYII